MAQLRHWDEQKGLIVPSAEATVQPLGSIDGCAPTQAGWLSRQARRMLALAGLVVGFWLLANLVSGAHASAAPAPAPAPLNVAPVSVAAQAIHASGVQPIVTGLVRSVRTAPAAVATRTDVAGLLSTATATARATTSTLRATTSTLRATVNTITNTTGYASSVALNAVAPAPSVLAARPTPAARRASAGSLVTAAHPAAPAVRAIQPPAPSAPIAAPARAAGTAAAPGTSATRFVTRTPSAPARPTRPTVPSALPGAGGPCSTQTSGGNAAATLAGAAFAPTMVMVSAPSSHAAAMRRSAGGRPSVSPD